MWGPGAMGLGCGVWGAGIVGLGTRTLGLGKTRVLGGPAHQQVNLVNLPSHFCSRDLCQVILGTA